MKIRIIEALAGKDFHHPPGTIIEWPDEDAKRLITAGFAVAVQEDFARANVETATLNSEQRGRVKLSRYTKPRKPE